MENEIFKKITIFQNLIPASMLTRSRGQQPEQNVWYCDFCAKPFASQRAYLIHVKTHRDDTPGDEQFGIHFKSIKLCIKNERT